MSRVVWRQCPMCAAWFIASRRQIYCTQKCRDRFYNLYNRVAKEISEERIMPKVGPRGGDYLWMKVTADKYEFPVLICDSITELAELTGKTEANIRSIVCKAEKGVALHPSFRRVPKN